MKLLDQRAIFSMLLLALAAWGCGGKSHSARIDPCKGADSDASGEASGPAHHQGRADARRPRRAAETYTVESGDSLSAIADKLGTTVDELMAANGLTSNDLSVGQVLRCRAAIRPAGQPLADEPHEDANARGKRRTADSDEATTATPADTDGDAGGDKRQRRPARRVHRASPATTPTISRCSFGVTVDELAAANHTTVDALRSLQVGDVLIIPPPSTTPEPADTPIPPEEGNARRE